MPFVLDANFSGLLEPHLGARLTFSINFATAGATSANRPAPALRYRRQTRIPVSGDAGATLTLGTALGQEQC